jgi:hypothetical protein
VLLNKKRAGRLTGEKRKPGEERFIDDCQSMGIECTGDGRSRMKTRMERFTIERSMLIENRRLTVDYTITDQCLIRLNSLNSSSFSVGENE